MDTNLTESDWAAITLEAIRRLKGSPNDKMSTRDELRWGEKGDFKLNLDKGYWYDFYSKEGGGALAFLRRELSVQNDGALDWLKSEGLLPEAQKSAKRPARWEVDESSLVMVDRHPLVSAPGGGSERYAQFAYAASVEVPDDPSHPARRWSGLHHCWQAGLPFPRGARWLSSDAGIFQGAHQGAGSLIVLASPLVYWQRSYPDPPRLTAVQLVNLDDDGRPALDRPDTYLNSRSEPRPGLFKRTYGKSAGRCVLYWRPPPRRS